MEEKSTATEIVFKCPNCGGESYREGKIASPPVVGFVAGRGLPEPIRALACRRCGYLQLFARAYGDK
jgi:predicted nucleic-acid-binding Zn-ribbon protein